MYVFINICPVPFNVFLRAFFKDNMEEKKIFFGKWNEGKEDYV